MGHSVVSTQLRRLSSDECCEWLVSNARGAEGVYICAVVHIPQLLQQELQLQLRCCVLR